MFRRNADRLKRDIDGLYQGHLAAEKRVRQLELALAEMVEDLRAEAEGKRNRSRITQIATLEELLGANW